MSLSIVVFFSGAILMALEILGSRVLAPHFGNSIFVWGSLIGVFLGALALGYFAGGALADARPHRRLLAVILGLSGVGVLAVPPLAPVAARLTALGPRGGPLAASLLLFFLPTVLMAMVSPYALRLTGAPTERLGRLAGRFYGISTAGSIVGTLATAFWLVPAMGVSRLISLLGAGLLALAAWILAAERRYLAAGTLLLAVAVVVQATTAPAPAAPAPGTPAPPIAGSDPEPEYEAGPGGVQLRVLFRQDSAYHHIRVTEGGGIRHLRFDNSYQSGMDLADPYRTVYAYTDYLHLAKALHPGARHVLFVGLGGGSAPKRFWRDYQEMQVDVVELDPAVVEVARRFFGLPDDPRLQVVVADGRTYLEETDRRYDLIILDAYYADAIPFHLMTQEFFGLVRDRLRPGGLLAANVIGSLEGSRSALYRSTWRTLASLFPAVYTFPVGGATDPSRMRNLILIAGSQPLLSASELHQTVSQAVSEGAVSVLALPRYAAGLYTGTPDTEGAPVLTDDYAPVDHLLHLSLGD